MARVDHLRHLLAHLFGFNRGEVEIADAGDGLTISMGNVVLVVVAAILTGVRLFIPTVGHSWPMVFITAAHIFVGVTLTLLWQKRGKWPLGWICLGVPTVLEAAMFFAVNG